MKVRVVYLDMPTLAPGWDILIYPGQSNTVGAGMGPFTDTDSSNDYRIFQVGRYGSNNMQVIAAVRPLQYWQGPFRHSFDVSLARYYAAQFLAPARSLIVIPAAEPGVSILLWLGLISGDPLYSDMANRIALCLGLSGVNRIVGWFEQQGETDVQYATTPANPHHAQMPNAATYHARKLDFIDRVRADFGTFPMAFGLFSDEWLPGDPVKAAFQDAIRQAARERDLCIVIDTAGLPSNQDYDPAQNPIHFSAAGQETLAQRHFEGYVQLRRTVCAARDFCAP